MLILLQIKIIFFDLEPIDTFKITIDPEYSSNGEDLGIEQVAFTAKPAVKIKGMAFNSDLKQNFADAPKMRIAAPALIPMEIYRNDDMGEYYVQFTESEIEKIHQKFMQNLTNVGKFNVEHDSNITVPAYILECWLVGEKNLEDRSYSEFGIQVPKGTLMMVAQITDKNYYTELVSKDQVGFSIEGFLGLKLSEIEQIKKEQSMKEDLKLPDGEHSIAGKIYVVKDGAITEVKEIVEMKEVECEDKPVEETPIEETKMEEVTEEVKEKTEEVKEVTLQVEEAEVMAIVQPKLDELYGVIADLKVLIEGQISHEKEDEDYAEPTQMSAHTKFAEVIKFASK
jgi:hypothetical protein